MSNEEMKMIAEHPEKYKVLVCLYDRLAGRYYNPAVVANLRVAKRDFVDLVCDHATEVGKHADDFELIMLGYWDEGEGLIIQDRTVVDKGLNHVSRES